MLRFAAGAIAVTASFAVQLGPATASDAARARAVAERTIATEIADALCGRGRTPSRQLADALDAPGDPSAPPAVWRRLAPAAMSKWLAAGECVQPSPEERARVRGRHRTLARLDATLTQARAVWIIASRISREPSGSIVDGEWPPAGECAACDRLRTAAELLRSLAAHLETPPTEPQTIGGWLDATRSLAEQLRPLCSAKATRGDLNDVSARYRYFTWTRSGAAILSATQLLDHRTLEPVCRTP
jgi:hypothetical protein